MTRTEMFSRYEVEMEHYAKIINIEALTMLEMTRKQLLPAINSYMGDLARTITAKRAVSESLSTHAETAILEKLSRDADKMSDTIEHLAAAERTAQTLSDMTAKANAFHDKVLPLMDALALLPTTPRPSAATSTGLCPATARCCTMWRSNPSLPKMKHRPGPAARARAPGLF